MQSAYLKYVKASCLIKKYELEHNTKKIWFGVDTHGLAIRLGKNMCWTLLHLVAVIYILVYDLVCEYKA